VIARADSISPYYLLFGRVPGSEREVKVKLKMPESLFDCYETAYISRIHFEIRSRLENSHTVTGQIEAMDYLTEEVHKAKECCTGTTNFKSECVTCAWTEEAAVAFLQVEGFDQVEEIETNGTILSEPDCVCDSEPADNYQETCMGTNCVEKQVGVGGFEIYQNTYSIDTLYHELERIATYFDSLGVNFYAGITDNRMFCVEGESTAFKSQEANKDMVHFQTQYDAAQVAFWFHFAEVNGKERIHIRQKGFEGEVLDCCCELIPGDCRGNPFSICEGLLENVAHYEAVCLGKRRDYLFLVEGNYYKHKKKVYVCEKNYPTDVVVVDAKTKIPLDTVFNWKVNGNVRSENTNTINIDTNDLNSNLAELEVEFTVKSGPKFKEIAIKIDVRSDIKVEFLKSSNTIFAFDENEVDTFREFVNYGEKAGTPWLFIESGQMDEVLAEVDKNNHYYVVNTIESNDPGLVPSPAGMASKEQEMQLNHNGSGHDIYEIFACDAEDPELLVYSADRKDFLINFYLLCDTDDDIQVVPKGSVVNSAMDVCISPGEDGSYDKPTSFSNKDSFAIIDDTVFLVAGKNLECDSKIYSPDYPPGGEDCPAPSTSMQDELLYLNNLYNKIGIYFSSSYQSYKKLYANFDGEDEDGLISSDEQKETIHAYLFGATNETADTLSAFYVKDIKPTTTQGRAIRNKKSLIINCSNFDENTLRHEVGHANFGLKHPGDPESDGEKGEFDYNDYYNFMHGISNEIYFYGVRRYQIGQIHNEE